MSQGNPASHGHQTTSGDNSSESGSHKKAKSSLEIVELKLKKCTSEIEAMKKRQQREWSLQMNNHLRGFYPEEAKSKADQFSSPISQSAAAHGESPADIENRIHLLQKKLSEYERRKQKLLLEETKSQAAAAESAAAKDQQIQSPATDALLFNDTHSQGSQQGNLTGLSALSAANESSAGSAATAMAGSSGNGANSSMGGPSSSSAGAAASTLTDSMISQSQLHATPNSTLVNNWNMAGSSHFGNGKLEFLGPTSFGFPGHLDYPDHSGNSNNINSSNGNGNNNNNGNSGNQEDQVGRTVSSSSNPPMHPALKGRVSSSANLNQTAGSNPGDQLITSPLFTSSAFQPSDSAEQTAASQALMALNKSLQNMMQLQAEHHHLVYHLKQQQEKMQSDLEDAQRKLEENQQLVLRELQHSYSQISEPIHKLSFNLYKSYDQKLDDFKQASLASMQQLGYSLNVNLRDIKEIKEDVTFMKNRVEIVEKTQKLLGGPAGGGGDSHSPTNYYGLFYKLLDIFLTLATIVLLAFTNLIASVKFVFLLYPRSIVLLLFLYLSAYYLVDYDRLLDLLDEPAAPRDKQNFGSKLILTLYRAFFPSRVTDARPPAHS